MQSLLIFILFSTISLIRAKDPLGNDISGNQQVGTVGSILQRPIVVRVLDSLGHPQVNIRVKFSVLEEPKENLLKKQFARLEPSVTKTDKEGYAMSRFRFGGTKGNYYVLVEAGSKSLIFKEIALERNWLLFFLFSLFGGLAIFLFGLNYGSKGLIRAAGAKMRDFLFSLTRNRFMALIIGIVVTIILGSSTAGSILLVRFVSGGIIQLEHALGVLLGINIGTTITVQILAFRILDYAILIVGIGFFLMQVSSRYRNIGQAVFGLGLLFFSLKLMSTATSNLRYLPVFHTIIAGISRYPLLGIIVAALITFLLRSSAATIGIILILAFDSLIEFGQAVPLVLGANLGTTFTALISSNTTEGRRVGLGHFLFNLITIAVLFPFLGYIPGLIKVFGGDIARQIANLHTLFNLFSAIIFLPLVHQVSQFLGGMVKEAREERPWVHRLDPAFLATPAIALGQATREILFMADIVNRMLEDSIKVFKNRDRNLLDKVVKTDDEVDAFEEKITPYLTKISEGEMDSKLSHYHHALLNAVNEIEHIGDVVSKNLMSYARKQIDTGFVFSQEGFIQIEKMHQFVCETLRTSIDALATRDRRLARAAVARKEEGYRLAKRYNELHLERLKKGMKQSLETSTIHLDIISDLERINFHAAEIGTGVV